METRKFRDLLVETETKQLRDRDLIENKKNSEIEFFLLNSDSKRKNYN